MGDNAFSGQGKSRDEELTKLKRELVKIKQERGFLKDAAVYFAGVAMETAKSYVQAVSVKFP